MKLNVMTLIKGLDGAALRVGDTTTIDGKTVNGPDMVLADVIENMALQPAPPGKSYSEQEQILRYDLAITSHRARTIDPPVIHVSPRMLTDIRKDVSRIYVPLVAGQVLQLLGAAPPPPAPES